jgi:hypothetical protein
MLAKSNLCMSEWSISNLLFNIFDACTAKK